jgi:hypothetical protein
MNDTFSRKEEDKLREQILAPRQKDKKGRKKLKIMYL